MATTKSKSIKKQSKTPCRRNTEARFDIAVVVGRNLTRDEAAHAIADVCTELPGR